jgi:hypothetical protein
LTIGTPDTATRARQDCHQQSRRPASRTLCRTPVGEEILPEICEDDRLQPHPVARIAHVLLDCINPRELLERLSGQRVTLDASYGAG